MIRYVNDDMILCSFDNINTAAYVRPVENLVVPDEKKSSSFFASCR